MQYGKIIEGDLVIKNENGYVDDESNASSSEYS